MTDQNRAVAKLTNKDSLSAFLGLVVASRLLARLDELIKPQQTAGFSSQSLPRVLLWTILLCSVGLLVKGVRKEATTNSVVTMATVRRLGVYAIYALSFVLYAFLVPIVGFLLATVIQGFGILANYRERRIITYVAVTGAIVVIFFFFRSGMFVLLPIGSVFGG